MKKSILGVGLILSISGAVFAQQSSATGSGSAQNNTAVTKNGNVISLASGTQVAAELQKSLNADKAKVGDQVVLKTTQSVKQNGKVVIEKGSKLLGRVTDVQRRANGQAGSKISVLFDTLKQGDTSIPVTATVISVTNAATRAAVNDSLFADSSVASSSSATASRPAAGGGLLGGVGSTVGGVADTAVSTVGGVTGTATNTLGGVTNTAASTLGSTTDSVGGTIRGLSVSQSANASASGGSTISLDSGNLKLEKGTTFGLALSTSSNAKSADGN